MAQLTPSDLAALRATGQSLEVAFQVGKGGASEGVVKELQAHLTREPLVKVRIFKSASEDADTRSVAEAIATAARVTLVEVRGHTALFHRPPRHKRGPDDF
ncbi:MAG: YhbY family RNA-binding protein [Candidatus Thermoplasmatota archaeon]